MATSSSKGGSKGPQGDPRQERDSAIAQLLSTGAFTANQVQTDAAFNQNIADSELARSIADAQQKHAATIEKTRASSRQKLGSKYIQLVNQGRQAEAKYQQARAAQQGQQPSAQDVLAGALKGTEVENINPMAPTSRGRFDVAGTGAADFVSNFGQPGGPQPGSPVAGLPVGAGPDQALRAAMPSPAGGGGQGPSLQVGGQTLQAPPEITKRVASLGAQPYRMEGGFSMAPTFEMQSITEPNVLTAGEVARMQMLQDQNIIETGLKLWQDADGGTPDEFIKATQAYYRGGDPNAMSALGSKYPSISKKVAQADLELRHEQMLTERSQRAVMAQQANLYGAQAAAWAMYNSGAANATNTYGFLGYGRGTGGGGGRPSLSGAGRGSASGSIAKLDLGNLVNNKGEINEVAWTQYQLAKLQEDNVIVYMPEDSGWSLGDEGKVAFASPMELATNIKIVNSPESTPEQRQVAAEWLDQLPWMEVDASDGITVQDIDMSKEPGASEITMRLLDRMELLKTAGLPLPDFMEAPMVNYRSMRLKELVAEERAKQAAAGAAAPAQQGVGYTPDTPIFGGVEQAAKTRAAIGKAAGEIGQAASQAAKGWKPGLRLKPNRAAEREEADQALIDALTGMVPKPGPTQPRQPPPNPNAPRLRGRE